MRRNLSLFFLFIVACAALAYKIDDDPFSVLIKKMQDYTEKYPQEKVHLHLDKPYYAVGDDIWFKAYVINSQTSKPSSISGILYVELINEKDSVKQQLKLPLMDGISWGDFKLPDTFTEGNYRIRAYTQLMRNAGPEFFFDKTIQIGNSWANQVFTSTKYEFSKENNADKVNVSIDFKDKDGKPYVENDVSYDVQLNYKSMAKGKAVTDAQGKINLSFLNSQPALYKSGKIIATLTLPDKKKITKEFPVNAASSAVDVQFFPESGNMLLEMPNKIGIKAVNAAGLGEDIKVSILNKDGLAVTESATEHLGMGNFMLVPETGQTYSAKVTFKDGSQRTMSLPTVVPEGYIISTSSNEENIVVKILISKKFVGQGELRLVAQHSSNVYFTVKTSSQKQVAVASIPKKDLPSGIIQLTLFSPANLPICERLVFVNNGADQINTTISTSKTSYSPKEKVDITLQASNSSKPVQGSFSVSVTNTASVKPNEESESNILSSLLLTSDLAGYIEKPNYYFLNKDEKAQRNLDNLMLTQGWSRILWKNVLSNTPPVTRFQAEKTMQISGTVTTYGNKPVPKGKVSLFSSSGGFFATDTLTDDKGRFVFELSFTDSTKFIVQARNEKGRKSVDIKIDAVPNQVVTRNKNTGDIEINVNEALSGYLKQSQNYFDELTRRGVLERSIVLKEVNITEKKNPAKNSSNWNGAGNADQVITADQIKNCMTLSQCLQGRVAGMIMRAGVPYLMRNGGQIPMTIMVDGMNVGSDFLDNIVVDDIETIEVLKSVGTTAIYGSNGAGGILLITTKRGEARSAASFFAPGIITYNPKGFSLLRTFYSPKYDVETPDNRSDFRSTVYWNPHIVTNESGKAEFNFYNTSETGTYRIVVEGMDLFGNIVHAVHTYEVK
ncbi:carboxypeptidase-like regulatory domain-containing protein [Pedobacter metabolipauper]|nr:carboxypeptidase-like regulatory domain-containing protein [Pedobacter metabolipauper]